MIDVLVADDERPARDELAHLLRADARIGDVVTAASGADALALLSGRVFAVAFLDIHMPGLNGHMRWAFRWWSPTTIFPAKHCPMPKPSSTRTCANAIFRRSHWRGWVWPSI